MKLIRITSLLLIIIAVSQINSPVQSTPYIGATIYDHNFGKCEHQNTKRNTDSLGQLIDTVKFNIRAIDQTTNKEDITSGIELAKIENNLNNLQGKADTVIRQNKVTILIDYPLTNKYIFTLSSEKGFTRELLAREISNHYNKLYADEESTATIKTIPVKDRTTYNRNKTNGKYGIWGHDIADLVLVEILVYKTTKGEIVLSLNIES